MAEISGFQEVAKVAPAMIKDMSRKQEQLKMGPNQSKRVEMATFDMNKKYEEYRKRGIFADFSDRKGPGMGIHPEGYSNDPLSQDEEVQYQKYLEEKEKLAK